MPTIQNRRATAAQWTAATPVLAAGELGFELDTNSAKIGDGLTAWADLPYLSDESLSELVETGRLSEAVLNATYAEVTRTGAPAVGQDEIAFSVRDYGAAGDGVTDDTAAFKRCIEAAIRTTTTIGGKGSVFIPRGTYIVQPNVLYNVSTAGTYHIIDGFSFRGEGRESSVLKMVTGGQEGWFYDNGSTSGQRFARVTFHGIAFTTDDTEFGNGFRQVSNGHEKQFFFTECRFNLGIISSHEGTGNADLLRYTNCAISASRSLMDLKNAQSVNNVFVGCAIGLYRDGVRVWAGGATKFLACNIEMHPHSSDTTTSHHLLKKMVVGGLGPGNEDFSLSGTRFEIHGDNKALVQAIDGDSGGMKIQFTDCATGTVNSTERVAVYATPGTSVQFRGCTLHERFLYVASGDAPSDPMGALIMFDGCSTGRGTPLHKRSTVVGLSARIVSTRCYRGGSYRSVSPIEVEDFDKGWTNGSPQTVTAQPKTVAIKRRVGGFPLPDTTNNDFTFELPEGAFIQEVYVYRPAIGGSGYPGPYRLHLGSDDKATIFASSEDGRTEGQSHTLRLASLRNPGGVLRVWATGVASAITSGSDDTVAYATYI